MKSKETHFSNGLSSASASVGGPRKSLRLDRPPGARALPESAPRHGADQKRWIDVLLKAFRSDPSERRESRRHPAVDPDVWIGWWSAEDFLSLNGRLLNISRGGALILLPSRPPRRTPIWLNKQVGDAVACVRAELVGSNPAPGGAHASRLRFVSPCPTVLCEAAVCSHQPIRE